MAHSKSNFRIYVEGFRLFNAARVSGLKLTIGVFNWKELGNNFTTLSFPEYQQFDPILIERAVRAGSSWSLDMYDWLTSHYELEASPFDSTNSWLALAMQLLGPLHRRNFRIESLTRGDKGVKAWNVYGGWVAGYEIDEMSAMDSEVLLSRLTIVHQGFEEVTSLW